MSRYIEKQDRELSETYRRIRKRRARARRKKRLARSAVLGILILAVLFYAIKLNTDSQAAQKEKTTEDDSYEEAKDSGEIDSKKKIPAVYPVFAASYADITEDSVKSPYIALLDATDNEIVAGKGYNEKIYPASMTKVMTLIVAVENLKNLDETFIMKSEIIDPLIKEDASRAGFIAGEEVSAKNLLYGLILPSGADAAVALAEMIAGSEEGFVDLMNQKCEELGLENTHFMNTTGLHDDNEYTTPVEMAMIMGYAMENETCAQVLSTYQYTTDATQQHPEGILLTSTMFSRMVGNEAEGVLIVAGKTGYTTQAGHCLVSYAQKDGRNYVAVTAGASGKWDVIFDDFEIYANYALIG